MIKIQKIIDELIEKYYMDTTKAINIENIIKDLNIRIVTADIGTGILGASKVIGLKQLIVISPNTYNEAQRNFTLAHELGHILLHRGTHYYLEKDYYTVKEKEDEANQFASKILLPDSEVKKSVKNLDININLIKDIANRYKTSITCTAIKILEITEETIFLIYHKNNQIKWWRKSNNEIFFNTSYSEIDLERLETKQDIATRKTDINLWIDSDDDIYSCYEETVYFNNLDEYLTIISIV